MRKREYNIKVLKLVAIILFLTIILIVIIKK